MTDDDGHVRLREFVERIIVEHDRFNAAQLEALRCKMMTELAQRDKALELQAEANQRHFELLNNEAGRILAASKMSVSRDTWDAFIATDGAWKTQADRKLQEAVTREDFQTYRDVTDKNFALREGEMRGRQRLFGIVAAFASFLAVIAGLSAIWTFVWSLPKGTL